MQCYFRTAALCVTIGLAGYFIGGSAIEAQQPVPTLDRMLTPGSVFADSRTPISSLPFTIDRCGSYFLTGCLTGVAGENGITIDADDVTLDLNGFGIEGVPGSLDGVHVTSGPRRNVLICDGSVRNWGDDGIDAGGGAAASHEIRILGVRAMGNASNGIRAGSETDIVSCSSNGNGADGISVGGGCTVEGNECRDNGRHGIVAENDCWILENFVDDHCDGSGIRTDSVATNIEHNAIGDCAIGIEVGGSGNLVIRNAVNDSNCDGTHYMIAAGNVVGPIVGTASGSGPWANFSY